ncbi:hypothetical protein PXO_03156 [Xanthomonas oryzae pv. oryzae PXO99A]|uniref:Uncharacterized protein n=1 Tax=Xanthomonas oryzae pv. oryzae (strain PXO99A) TaxID=360094 RepID=A0A0K0GPM1_XANOP|nr:hypothetical protein PXO_03156 [Xanthomonas oryzae pv. oryzae PXO99A]
MNPVQPRVSMRRAARAIQTRLLQSPTFSGNLHVQPHHS